MSENNFSGLEEQLAVERRKVDVGAVSFSVRELVRMFEEGELSIAPSYQRKYRWPKAVASTFIESLFLGLPIPPIFVATNDNFQWEVVDGLQRISTLIMFISQSEEQLKKIGRDAPLKLEGLTKLSQLNGVAIEDMPIAIQRYFGRQPLQLISLTDKSDKSVRFDLFERLNSGAISLTSQEVRSAVYRGDFVEFAEELSASTAFTALLKLQEANRHDGTAAEQVIKFFAYKNARDDFAGGVSRFVNEFTDSATKSFDYSREREIFESTFRSLSDFLNDGPFLRKNTHVTPLVQFEACGVALGELIQEGNLPTPPLTDWLNDPELVEASTGGTNTRSMLKRRIERARALLSGDE